MDTDQTNRIEIDINSLAVDGHGDAYSIDLNNMNSSAIGSTDWITGSNGPYTIGPIPNIFTSSNTTPNWTFTDLNLATPSTSGKISLQGDNADIEINGESVVSMLREIRDRLNILQVSEEMEQEWDELRALREQYEAKLAECREKSKMWGALKR